MKRSSYLAALVVAFGIGIPLHASAAPKVALTPIEGDKDGDVRDAVSEALEGNDLVVIAKKDVNKASSKIEDWSDLSEADAKKLAGALDADAIIHAKLDKGDDGKTLKFVLFVSGKKQKGFSVTFSNARSPKFRKALHDKMVSKISAAKSDSEEVATTTKKKKGGEEEEVATTTKKKKGGEEATTKKKKGGEEEEEVATTTKKKKGGEEATTKKKKGGEEEEEVATTTKKKKGGEEEEEEEVVKPRKKGRVAAAGEEEEEGSVGVRSGGIFPKEKGRSANRAAIRLDSGVSFAKRTLAFTSNLQADQRPKPFNPSPVPGARLDLELYPLAFSNPRGTGSGLGVAVEYDKTIGFNVGSTAEAVRLPVNQQHMSVSGRYRLVIGDSATAPSITPGFGYGRRTFIVTNRNKLMDQKSLDLPDTDYQYFAPSLNFRVPLGGAVALVAGGEGMLVMNAGPIQNANSYGRAKIFGVTGGAGLDIVLGSRIALNFRGEFTRVGFTFVGNGGDLANNRDGNPQTRDVGGAADQSFGGAATLGVMY